MYRESASDDCLASLTKLGFAVGTKLVSFPDSLPLGQS